MATQKQRAAARSNVKKAQAGVEASKVRRGEEPTRKELEAEARRLDISGRSKMAKAELKRAVSRAKKRG